MIRVSQACVIVCGVNRIQVGECRTFGLFLHIGMKIEPFKYYEVIPQ